MKRAKVILLATVLMFSVIVMLFVGLPYFHFNLMAAQASAYSTSIQGCPANSDQSAPADVIANPGLLYEVHGTTALYDGPGADIIPGADGLALTVEGGQSFTIIGYNKAGDWTKIQIGCSTAWVKS